MTMNMFMEVASMGPAIGACFLAIFQAAEREWLKINAPSVEMFKLQLHKINLKYFSMFYITVYVAGAHVCYLAVQSLPCVKFTSVNPWGGISNVDEVLLADVYVQCSSYAYLYTRDWCVGALVAYSVGVMVSECTL
jgi:hypothetical protein